jgi:Tfp pilus tip-associated adhesin PilY1
MNNNSHTPTPATRGSTTRQVMAAVVLVSLGLSAPSFVLSAPTDIARAPITGGASGQVKPNIMLLMDTSRSLAWTHMPDQLEEIDIPGSTKGLAYIGYKSFQCNALYYNPNGSYPLPKDASGASLPVPSFINAPYNGYNTSQGSTNLSANFQAYQSTFAAKDKSTLAYGAVAPDGSGDISDPPQQAYYYIYTGSQITLPPAGTGKLSPLLAPCTDIDTNVTKAATGGGTWTRVLVSANSGTAGSDERAKFAIWYTYYRTRMTLTKSAVSLAFSPITDNYRVGFISAFPSTTAGGPVVPAKYLPIADFGGTQRTDWFNKLFAQVPLNSSPMREGLARVGRHYAGKQDFINTGMTGDPVQFSCQQNFVIMTTDGYWNTNQETTIGSGAIALNGTSQVGQQDGLLAKTNPLSVPGNESVPKVFLPCKVGGEDCAPRPMWDGGGDVTRVTTDVSNEYRDQNCNSPFFFWNRSQVQRSTFQQRRSTSQYTQFTKQTTQTDFTQLRSTTQMLRNTSQNRQQTTQFRVDTLQNLAATRRQTVTPRQFVLTTAPSFDRRTIQRIERVTVNLANTTRITADTRVVRETRLQQQQTTSQMRRTIIQNRSTTSSTTRTRTQRSEVRSQVRESTSQTTRTQTQVRRSTSQIFAKGADEVSNPVAACPTSGFICNTVTTGPTLVASCTAAAAVISNSYITTTCAPVAPVVSFVDTATCVDGNSGSPNFIQTACSTATTSNVLVASCSPQTAGSGNNWLTRTCATTTTAGPAFVQTCSPQTASSGNGFVTIVCNVPVSSVSPVNDGPTPVAAASCVNQTATSGNNWLTIVCSPTGNITQFIPTTCVASGETSPNFVTTTCPGVVITENDLPVNSCSASSGSSPNWQITTCNPTVPTAPTFVASCTVGTTTTGSPNHIKTTCTNTIDTANVPISGTCTAGVTADFIRTTCPPDIVNTGVGVASCTPAIAATSPFTRLTNCVPVNLTNVPIAGTCATTGPNSGNNWTAITSCPTQSVTDSFVAACTNNSPAASAPLWRNISCPAPTTTGPFNAPTCTPIAPVGPLFVETTCTPVNATSTPVQTCPAMLLPGQTCVTNVLADEGVVSCTTGNVTPGTSPNWIFRTCNAPVTTTATPVASCTVGPANSGNNFTQVTGCPTPNATSNFVSSCTVGVTNPNAGNNFTRTECLNPAGANNANTAIAGTCVPVTATGPNFVATTCPPPTVITGTPVASCTVGQVVNTFENTTACNTVIDPDRPVAPGTCAVGTDVGAFTFITACNTLAPPPRFSSTCVDNPGTSSPFMRTTCNEVTSSTAAVQVCTPGTVDSGSPNFIRTTCNLVTTGPTGVQDGTCTDITAAGPNWITTTCSRNDTPPTFVNPTTCTAASTAGTSGNNWVRTVCATVADASPVNPDLTRIPVATCPAAMGLTQAPTSGNQFTTITCVQAPGKRREYRSTTSVLSQFFSNGTEINITPAVLTGPTGWTQMESTCFATGAVAPNPIFPGVPATGRPGEAVPTGDPVRPLVPAPTGACTVWPCVVQSGGFGGKANTLSDVAQYYYANDLRPSMEDDVPPAGAGIENDIAPWQHMTTFSIGLGVTGVRTYDPNYKSASSGDFANIRSGVSSWPLPPSLGDSPASESPATIDDFWHAAVNGRGQYFSADNPTQVISGLSAALFAINDRGGAGAAAGVSATKLTQGSNFAYFSSYITQRWTGEIEAREIDGTTGAPSDIAAWSAKVLLDAKVKAQCDNRKIYLMRKGATNNRVNFSFDTKACDANGLPTGTADTGLNATEQTFFNASTVANFSQYIAMTDGSSGSVDQRSLAAGANLVNFIRGQRGLEGFEANVANKLYRSRASVFGAPINGEPVYLKALDLRYSDTGYANFKSTISNRIPMLYVPANDGMLHAFYAGQSASDPLAGQEAWAIVPSAVLPNLHKLADNNFGTNFQYSVDGTPSVGDIYDGANWRSILVAGLNSGGRGYYAMDVTDPLVPKVMWEFNWSNTCYDVGNNATWGADCHIGLSYGLPIITKLANGTWVVIVTSGYNNVNSPPKAGDGVGYLYVLNATTGEIISKISTGEGDATTPSGLARVSSFVDNTRVNNTVRRVYGGDMLGNVWRFDVNNTIAPTGNEATRITVLKDAGGKVQPITTRPELGERDGKTYVLVGTGRLLGSTDLTDNSTQSVYGIVDTVPNNGAELYPNVRTALRPLAMTTTGSGSATRRTIACTGSTAVCDLNTGWYFDLPDSGERVNVEPQLQLGVLAFISNVPQGTACSIKGYSYLNSVDFVTGLAIDPNSASQKLVPKNPDGTDRVIDQSLTVGFNILQVADGSLTALVSPASGKAFAQKIPPKPPEPVGKRVSWQEISQ